MIDKHTKGCSCGMCDEQEIKKQCQCESCRDNTKPVQEENRNNCHWKDHDQLRKHHWESSNHHKDKFIWETNCECHGCRQ